MSRLVVNTFLTLDGVMQSPGGPEEDPSDGFDHGGWLVPHFDDDTGRLVSESFARAGSFLLGRRTYQIFAAHWPKVTDPDDPVAAGLNTLPKYVATTTLDTAEWTNTTLLTGDLVEAVIALKDQPGNGMDKEIQVHGSADLAQTLIAHDLVDEYRLYVFPVVLGTGKRLFGRGTVPTGMRLVRNETTSSGIAYLAYERAGAPAFGSLLLAE
jgi:dihydrofolate reductase